MTPTATPSRRESETEAPFQSSLIPITGMPLSFDIKLHVSLAICFVTAEESSHDGTAQVYEISTIEEETSCQDNMMAPLQPDVR